MSFQCSRSQILSSLLHRENPPIKKQNELLIVPFCSWCLAYLIALFQRFSKLICQNFDFSLKLIITTNFSMRLTPSPISFLRFELHHICFKKKLTKLEEQKGKMWIKISSFYYNMLDLLVLTNNPNVDASIKLFSRSVKYKFRILHRFRNRCFHHRRQRLMSSPHR